MLAYEKHKTSVSMTASPRVVCGTHGWSEPGIGAGRRNVGSTWKGSQVEGKSPAGGRGMNLLRQGGC